jgi:hypothetical protein
LTIEVRCEACERRVRITRARASEERSEAVAVRKDYARVCPRNRGSNALPCPMSVNHESEAEKAI